MARRRDRDVFDQGLWGRSRWRAARRALIGLVLLGFFVETHGHPELRLVQPGPGRRAVYFGVRGERSAGMRTPAPLVVLRKLDRSLLEIAQGVFGDVLEER